MALPEVAKAIDVHIKCLRQFNTDLNGNSRFDWIGIREVARIHKIKITPKLFRYLSKIEDEISVIRKEQSDARAAERDAKRSHHG